MISQLNDYYIYQTVIAAIMIILGVVIKNSLKIFTDKTVSDFMKLLGVSFFLFGWIYMAFILSKDRSNSLVIIVSSLGILLSAMIMNYLMEKNLEINIILPIIFIVCWLLLGFSIGTHLKDYKKYLGIFAGLLVILSMVVSLPFQRQNCLVDGPGMPLFVIAWFIVVYLNSLNR